MTHPELLWAEDTLRDQCVDQPKMEVQLLLGYVLNLSRSQILAEMFGPLSTEDLDRFHSVIDRRSKGEPLAYIRGFKEFYSHNFYVNSSVLIPRPETELLVEQAVLRSKPGDLIGDICTGSGCVALSIALARSDLQLIASDISLSALKVAEINRRSYTLESQVKLLQADGCEALQPQSLSILVSNPPYIETSHINTLQREIRLFEPGIALDGGDDGMRFYRKLADDGRRCLKTGGTIILEAGFGQSDAILKLLSDSGFIKLHCMRDLSGIERVVIGELGD